MTSPTRDPRIFPALVSLGAGLLIFAAKLVAWQWTGSTAVLSDALESIVNVVAAGFALFSVRFAAQPADREHPYGHGKIELMSAAFEGGLVAFAAVAIFATGVEALIVGPELRRLDLGLLVTAAAGAANLLLGAWLVKRGRALRSAALEADGHHVLSDVWTTAGVLLGLGLVRVTGIAWLDPIAALAVGLLLARTGLRLVKEGAAGLLDAEDPALTQRLCDAFDAARLPGVIHLHHLRTIRAGHEVHIDAHAIVPEHWSVAEAHLALHRLEEGMLAAAGAKGELALHLDPCRRERCEECDLPACPIREVAFVARRPADPAEVARPPDVVDTPA